MKPLTKYELIKDIALLAISVFSVMSILSRNIELIEYVWNDSLTIQGLFWQVGLIFCCATIYHYLKRINIWIKHFIIEREKKKESKI